MDRATEHGGEIRERFNTGPTPTYIVLTPGGEVLASWIGFANGEDWAARLAPILADPVTAAEREARLARTPTFADAMVLADNATGTGDFEKAIGFYDRALELDRDAAVAKQALSAILYCNLRGHGSDLFTLDQVLAAADAVLAEPASGFEDLLDLGGSVAGLVEDAGRERVAPYLDEVMRRTEDVPEDLQSWRRYVATYHALISLQDPDRALELRLASMPEGWEDDPSRLNSIAWWAFRNNVHLDRAEPWARRGIELAGSDGEKANIIDTLAEILNARGDVGGAVEWMRQAVALAPDDEGFAEKLARFEAALAD